TSPSSLLTQEDMGAINAVTTEDLVKFEPSLVIRRRFIGDSNGTLGLRGSNMFQTSRSMVFADGVPLHYFLQSRWNGAPRWTLVSASEIAQVEVLYGPFSAEYSGNSMGGVVLIETAIPQEREVHVDASYFNQSFDAYGFDGNVDGFKGFASYGDKVGDLSVYFSVNHLENSSQPQTFRDTSFSAAPEGASDTVSGAIVGNDSRGGSRFWYGDTGTVETTTDNLKFKLGYEFGHWTSLLNVGYEDRNSVSGSANSYVTDEDGNALWSGSDLIQDGQQFSFNSARLNASELDRQSLSIGFRLKGELTERAKLEANINRFSILEDQARSSLRNPSDPTHTSEGQITDYDDSGWTTAEVKLSVDELFVPGLELITGARHEEFELNLNVFDSPNYQSGVKGDYTSRFGGSTRISAIYAQANWQLNEKWNTAFGLRHESFTSHDGYFDNDDASTPELELEQIPNDSASKLSPKFSLGYQANEDWVVRYSLAKAYRFPIVEELFSQYKAYNTVALSNPDLKPEDGTHHNLMLDRSIEGGYIRMNIFQESIDNAIESQTDTRTNVRSFVPIDQIDVLGTEFIVNQTGFLTPNLDLRFNLTWIDAQIVDNSSAESAADFDPDDSIEGNQYPRMPKWRGNILSTYHVSNKLDLSANVQYASNSFGRLENNDTESQVYGAQDGYTRVGLKSSYRFDGGVAVSLGIDNLTNEIAYVAHPWPGRTVYLNFSYDL
ncbi:MAG: iron complex outermembrane receptor protein, partial [Thalassolituus oleivorans]